jgi:hypothetical protein
VITSPRIRTFALLALGTLAFGFIWTILGNAAAGTQIPFAGSLFLCTIAPISLLLGIGGLVFPKLMGEGVQTQIQWRTMDTQTRVIYAACIIGGGLLGLLYWAWLLGYEPF